jgi:hypothetical protein
MKKILEPCCDCYNSLLLLGLFSVKKLAGTAVPLAIIIFDCTKKFGLLKYKKTYFLINWLLEDTYFETKKYIANCLKQSN